MDEVGNTPAMGEVLSWSESSAVVYANSVLGARCNRNSGIIDLMGSVVGYVPRFGLLTDEGRKATWIVKIETTKKPEAQLLGSRHWYESHGGCSLYRRTGQMAGR